MLEATIPPGTIPAPSTLSPNPATTATLTEAEAEPSAPYRFVLEAVVKVPRRHDPLHQEAPLHDVLAYPPESERRLRSSKVPSSRIGRLFHYGGLAASLGFGAAFELLRRSTASPTDSTDFPSSLMMIEANLTRLVSKLTRMRGAALKVGQFLSVQDTHELPSRLL